MHPSVSHQQKRRNINSSPPPPHSDDSSYPFSVSSPPLPAHIQSSLLNVGMRIRKSVSSGYKTKTECFPAYQPSGIAINGPVDITNTQEPYHERNEDEGFFSMPSSQERGAKRAGSDEETVVKEEEKVVAAVNNKLSALDVLMSNRHLAIPKSQIKRKSRKREFHIAVVRKEATTSTTAPTSDTSLSAIGLEGTQPPDTEDDFGEAGFLRPAGELEMEMEDV